MTKPNKNIRIINNHGEEMAKLIEMYRDEIIACDLSEDISDLVRLEVFYKDGFKKIKIDWV